MKKLSLYALLLGLCLALFTLSANAQFDPHKNGCTKFMGRDKQALCTTEAGHQACLVALKKGEWDACWNSAKPGAQVIRATSGEAKDDLLKRGCKLVAPGVYECPDDSTFNICTGYKNYGSANSCRKPNASALPQMGGKNSGKMIFLWAYNDQNKLALRKMTAAGDFEETWRDVDALGGAGNGNSPSACSPNPGDIAVLRHSFGPVISFDYYKEMFSPTDRYFYGSSANPGLTCRPGNRMAMFIRLFDGSVGYNWWENNEWGKKTTKKLQGDNKLLLDFVSLGGKINGTPTGVDYGANQLAVFALGTDGYIWWNHGNGQTWSGWESLGGLVMSSAASAISRKTGEIELFARGADNKLWARQYKNNNWTAWMPWGGPVLMGAPSATSWGGNRIDVFARNAAGKVVHFWKEDGTPIGVAGQNRILPGDPAHSDVAAVAVNW